MSRYVAFLGSINVGGNRLTMADLRWAFEREGFENVETVVASGNVLFDFDDRPTDGLEELFAYMMADRFDIDSFAAVRSRDEVAQVLADNPFAADGEDNRVHVLFLSGDPEAVHAAGASVIAAKGGIRAISEVVAGPLHHHIIWPEGMMPMEILEDDEEDEA